MAVLTSHDKSSERHDDAIIPLRKDAVALFYTRAAVAVTCTDNRFRVASLSHVLVDGGSSSNLIPEGMVDKLKIRTIPIQGGRIEVADGSRSSIDSLVWLQVTVGNEEASSLAGVTRVVAALVVRGEPSFQLLLGRHWMSACGLTGNYRDGTYTYRDDSGNIRNMLRSKSSKCPSSLPGPIHVQVDAIHEYDTASTDSDTENEDVDEDQVSRQLGKVIRQAEDDHYLAHEESSQEN
jgi:hypothetical protein